MAKSICCKTCKRDTLHHEFDDKAVSSGKVAGALFTGGLSLLVTGIRKGKNHACVVCGSVN
jgi:hypothetical protein